MDDASGTFFAAMLTIIALVVLMTVLIALAPVILLALVICVVWGAFSPPLKADGGAIEAQPRKRP